jgi:hypothetical protein
MEGADERLIFQKEGVDPRGKANQGFFPVNSAVDLGSLIRLSLIDKVLNELFQDRIWVLEENDLFFFRHRSLLLQDQFNSFSVRQNIRLKTPHPFRASCHDILGR